MAAQTATVGRGRPTTRHMRPVPGWFGTAPEPAAVASQVTNPTSGYLANLARTIQGRPCKDAKKGAGSVSGGARRDSVEDAEPGQGAAYSMNLLLCKARQDKGSSVDFSAIVLQPHCFGILFCEDTRRFAERSGRVLRAEAEPNLAAGVANRYERGQVWRAARRDNRACRRQTQRYYLG